MQYTRPDLMYTANHMSSYNDAPYTPVFKGINNLIHYVAGFPRLPAVYPSGLDITTTHELSQEVSPVNFYSQNIFNDLVSFTDGGEGLAYNYRCAISCVIICIFSAHWYAKTQPDYVNHST